MGHAMTIPQLVLVVVAAMLGSKRLRRMTDSSWSSLRNELRNHIPVYSAETTNGKEAEFIRDRLPKRMAKVVLVLIVVFGAVVWWLTR
jgi:hypothetical protein